MATLAQLRAKVQTRLRDWKQELYHPSELNALLNEAQDRFSKETGYLQVVSTQDILAGQSLYQVKPSAGFRVGRFRSVKIYDGSVDAWPIHPITAPELDRMDYDYRHRIGGRAIYYIRNFNPTASDSVANDSLWLYPTPDTNYTDGLRVSHDFITEGQMVADATEMALPDRVAEEAIINYAVAEALMRNALAVEVEASKVMMGQSQEYRKRFQDDLLRAAGEARTGYDHTSQTIRTYYL